MVEFPDVVGGWWTRFDRYEIRDGYIRPAPGAVVEKFHLWKPVIQTNAETSPQHTRPYQPFLEIAEAVGEENLLNPTSEFEEKVLHFCSRFGLLGILLQRAHSVTLAPRWEMIGDFEPDYTEEGFLVRSVLTYQRTGLGWQGYRYQDTRPMRDNTKKDRGRLLSKRESSKFHKSPSVVMRDLYDFTLVEEALGRTWAGYFPDVPAEDVETFRYPIPLSEEFWCAYSEPLIRFVSVASRFREALLKLSGLRSGQIDPYGVPAAGKILNALLVGVSPAAVIFKDGTIEQRWETPSLIGSFAMMALQDLSEQGRLLRCQVCGTLFFTQAYQATYCSAKCRHTAQKRRYRTKQREKDDGQTRSQ